MTQDILLLTALVAVVLIGSAMCSGIEAALLAVNPLHVHELATRSPKVLGAKRLEKLPYVKQIIGVDTYVSKFRTKKMKYIQYDDFFKKNKKIFDVVIAVDVLHHVGIDKSHIILKKLYI